MSRRLACESAWFGKRRIEEFIVHTFEASLGNWECMRIYSQQGVHRAAFALAPSRNWREESDTEKLQGKMRCRYWRNAYCSYTFELQI